MARTIVLALALAALALVGSLVIARALASDPSPPRARRLEPRIAVVADLGEVPVRLRCRVMSSVEEVLIARVRRWSESFAIEPAGPALFVVALGERPARVAAILADLGTAEEFPVPVRFEPWEAES